MIHFLNIVFSKILNILEGTIEFISSVFTEIFPPSRKTELDADFVPAWELLSSSEHGWCLNGKKSISLSESHRHCLVIGSSGSSKTTGVLIPSIFNTIRGNSSIVINDIRGDVYEKVSGPLADMGVNVKRIDFCRPEISEGFNPLLRCHSISDIQRTAHLLIRNSLGETSKDPFWNRSAEMIFDLFLRYLVFYVEPQLCTLRNLSYLIDNFSANPEKVDKLIVATHDDELITSYKAINAYESRTLNNILSTARAALQSFSDPALVKVTSFDTIDFESFRREKTALFLCNRVRDQHYYRSISALFFETFFNEILSRIPNEKENSILFLLDECATMYFSSLSTMISVARAHRCGLMLLIQDYSQLISLYSREEAHNIKSSTYCKVYMPGQQAIDTCKELQDILGVFQYIDEKEIKRTRPLRTSDEIRQLDKAIVLVGNKAPILTSITPYYKQRRLRRLTSFPPYKLPNKLPFQTPPLIQFS